MSNKIIQILLNTTFILMISCFNKTDNKLFGSTHFLKPKNKTVNLTHTEMLHRKNITVEKGNFTITNSKINIINNTIGNDVKNDLNMNMTHHMPKIVDIFNPFLLSLQKFFGIKPSPKTSPDFNGIKANFTGNGTYKYTNFTNGHSLELHITQVSQPSHMENIKNNVHQLKKKTIKNVPHSPSFLGLSNNLKHIIY